MFNQWCTIESDPGVFTELVRQMGAPSVQVEEIYSLEEDPLLAPGGPEVYGLIFLFKWTREVEKKDCLLDYDPELFFARQVVNNACATQAILSVLLNAPIPIEAHLKEFRDFSKELSPQDRGLVLGNSQAIRRLHNSFSRPEPFIFREDKRKKRKEGEVYHFVSYVPWKGRLYELDGLQGGPILVGSYEGGEWVELARREIQGRLASFGQEIRFNLMLVCEDLSARAARDIQGLIGSRAAIARALRDKGAPFEAGLVELHPEVKEEGEVADLAARDAQLAERIAEKEAFVHGELLRAEERREENVRRKHNYVPLIIQVLKGLAAKKRLGELIDRAGKKS